MVDLVTEAARPLAFLQARRWRFCLIGGIAVLDWGERRLTGDLDLSLFTGFGSERARYREFHKDVGIFQYTL